MIVFLAAAAASAVPSAPLPATPSPAAQRVSREEVAPATPVPPRGVDTRKVAVDAPEIEMSLLDVEQGPVLRMGALGGRHGAAPKLAHIAVGWVF